MKLRALFYMRPRLKRVACFDCRHRLGDIKWGKPNYCSAVIRFDSVYGKSVSPCRDTNPLGFCRFFQTEK